MNQLIEDLLAYSRLERRKLQSIPVHLRALLEAIRALYADEIERRGIDVQIDVPDVTLKVDPEGLSMALRNLIDNALKFTQTVPQPQLAVGGRIEGATCTLWVRDNGIGFDMKYHERIFEIFQRLNADDEYPGTGIGLAIVRKATERMGGRVWAKSERGEGTTFVLEMPCIQGELP
jgi:signal transduction histidine kinase